MGGAQAEEVEKPADLRSKTLQDLLQRVKKREKQVVNTTERVREAREAADAAAKALRDEEALLARHQASLKELKQIVKDKEIAEAVPVLGQTAATLGLAGVDQALAVIHQLSETLSQFEAMPGLATFAGQLRTSVTEQRQGIAQQQQQAQVAEAAREEAEAKLAADRGAAAAAAPAAGAEPGGGEAMAVDGGGLDVDLDDPDLASKLKEAGLGEFDLSQEADREKPGHRERELAAGLGPRYPHGERYGVVFRPGPAGGALGCWCSFGGPRHPVRESWRRRGCAHRAPRGVAAGTPPQGAAPGGLGQEVGLAGGPEFGLRPRGVYWRQGEPVVQR
eukprot:9498918-Pyramimonas_sp.AAC.1